MQSVEEMKSMGRQASREAIPWVVWLARLGYAAKGVVYIVIGALALQVAMGSGGQTTGPRGALREIGQEPFGQVLVGIVGLGLFGYAIWRFVQAWVDPDDAGSDVKGIVKRIGWAVSGVTYGVFGVFAFLILTGSSSGSGGGAESLTAQLMSQPFGIWLVGIVGVILAGTGLYQFYRAYTAKFREKLKLGEMSTTEITWATRSGRLGFAARGVVYVLIGIFLIRAALEADPSEAGGLGEALDTLAAQPYGPWMLGIVALGLIAYGAFAFVLARYRRIFLH